MIVFGDFNLPMVTWSPCPVSNILIPSSINRFHNFFDLLSDINLSQINNVHNVYNKMLDLVFSNVSEISIVKVDPFVIPEDIYHPTLLISLDTDYVRPVVEVCTSRTFNFKKCNVTDLR